LGLWRALHADGVGVVSRINLLDKRLDNAGTPSSPLQPVAAALVVFRTELEQHSTKAHVLRPLFEADGYMD
jgi:hypothetical protein